ncbi:molecular chaperone [Lichtheimia corymbifera JMRC:FSU:9682]|uniref:Molecular chaperone n=1 Tax=Lichtheimia corymbifera JMRC:FSU:9682 TaxID=1263082 RepID=A0A068RET6_9FUNG|nr:molecular chaperone [Lichtheimia corymbifera JMRC:FSU:9682]
METQVDEILAVSTDYYQVLDIEPDATTQEIRQAYIRTSRWCHPDKFVPGYPPATECFQLVKEAYETLGDPIARRKYDLARFTVPDLQHDKEEDDIEYAGDVFERMLYQAYEDMMAGEFQALRALLCVVRGTEEDVDNYLLDRMEVGLRNVHHVLTRTRRCYTAIRDDLLNLYELQQQLRSLSYFNVVGRIRLSMEICKIMLTMTLRKGTGVHVPPTVERTLMGIIDLLDTLKDQI